MRGWSAEDGARKQELAGHNEDVHAVAFHPDGKSLVSGDLKGIVHVWDMESGKMKHTISIGTDDDGYVCDLHLHSAGFVMAVTSGNPGVGKLLFQRPADAQPFFLYTKPPNCHSLALHPNRQRLAVSATNAGSNGRLVGKDKEYSGNYSPIHLFNYSPIHHFDLPAPA